MGILEEFKYYKSLLSQYFVKRFDLKVYAGLSLLLVILGISQGFEIIIQMENLLFIFASLLGFRLLDDAWSFHLDRTQHPDRAYIHQVHFKKFILSVTTIFIVYQTALFICSYYLGVTILILSLSSCFLYLLFYTNKQAMTIIPLLKYPILIWCISGFSTSLEVILLSIGAFFMMLSVDLFKDNPSLSKGLQLKITILLIAGLLIMQPWHDKTNMVLDLFLIAMPFILLMNIRLKISYILLVIIFPTMHVIDLLL